ncbi:MAG: DUF928 domain-containing protein [Terriglobales bacterium]
MKFVRLLFLLLAANLAIGQGPPPSPQPPPKPPQSSAKDAPKAPPRKRLVADLSGFEMSDPNQTRKQRAMLGATRGGPSRLPLLLAPDLAKFYGSSPLFIWLYPGRTEGFEIVLRDDDNELLRQQVSAAEFRLKDASSRFQPGKTYYWSVRPVPSLMESRFSQAAGFVVVADSERQQIEKELAAISQGDTYQAGTARARVLVNHRLWYDAIGAYGDLIKQFPDRAELYEERGTVYAQIEVTKAQADADFARADELQAKQAGK